MRTVIEKVMAAEGEARKILAEAKEESDGIVAAGRAEAARIEEEGRKSTRNETEAIVGRAVAEAEARAAETLAAAKSAVDAEVSVGEGKLDEVARAIAEAVVSAAG